MTAITVRCNKVAGLAGIALCAVGVTQVPAAFAQEAAATAAPQETAYEIGPQSLSSALRQFAAQSRMQLLFSEGDVAGRTTHGLNGTFPAEEAMEKLLAGSGLTFEIPKSDTVVIRVSRSRNTNSASLVHTHIAESLPGTERPAGNGDAAPARQPASALEEVIVTAQRREERLQDVPISISALTAEALDARNINGIERIDSYTPNLKIYQGTYSTGTTISIRGTLEINPAPYFDPAVGIYIDGVYVGKAQGNLFDLADLERVEVLRGPQGTLYGRNVFAGGINLISAKPTGEFGGKIKIGAGNYDAKRARFSLDLPRFGDFSVKLSGLVDKHGGYATVRDNPFPNVAQAKPRNVGSMGDADNKAARLAVRYQPADSLTVDYTFDYSKVDAHPRPLYLHNVAAAPLPGALFDPASPAYAGALVGGTYLGFPGDLYVQPNYSGFNYENGSVNNAAPEEHDSIYGHALTAAWDLGGITLKSISAIRRMDFGNHFDLDGTPLPLAAGLLRNAFRQQSQEFQAIGSAGPVNYTAGLYYYRERGDAVNQQQFFGNANTTDSSYSYGTDAYAAYGQADYHLTDAITLTGGVRYSEERKIFDARLRTIAVATGVVTSIYPKTHGSATNHAITPTAIFKYAFSPDANVYVKYARGFKSGGFNLGASAAFAVTHYDPEFMDSYEIGTKLRFLGGSVQVNAAGFVNKVQDLQVSVFRNSGILTASVIDNAARATIKGLELEAQWFPVDRLRLSGSVGYTDPQYDGYLDAGVDVSNTRVIPYVSKITASFGVDATLVQATWGQVHAMVDYSHADDYYTLAFDKRPRSAAIRQSAQPTRAQSIDLVDATLQVADLNVGMGSLELSLWSHNLFNVHRFVGGNDFGAAFGNLTAGFYNTPRTYGIDATYKF